jgi:hypothetical protein
MQTKIADLVLPTKEFSVNVFNKSLFNLADLTKSNLLAIFMQIGILVLN